MREIEIKLSLYNNRLKQRRQQLGLSQIALAQSIGVSTERYAALEALRISPVVRKRLCAEEGCNSFPSNRTGTCRRHYVTGAPRREETRYAPPVWSQTALACSAFFDVPIEELFPEGVRTLGARTMSLKADAEEVFALLGNGPPPNPEDLVVSSQLRERVAEALLHLSPREQTSIALMFGLGGHEPMKLDDIGDAFGVSRERVRQIAMKGLRKLRYGARIGKNALDAFRDDDDAPLKAT